MEKNEKYIETKRKYNSNLSTFQISKELHKSVKEYCKSRNIKVKDFLEEIIKKSI
jgi:hypothetical protein